jgi:hypothetical protein
MEKSKGDEIIARHEQSQRDDVLRVAGFIVGEVEKKVKRDAVVKPEVHISQVFSEMGILPDGSYDV